jgi:hypothetical protein
VGTLLIILINIKVKGKATPSTGRGDSQDCETSRIPHFLDNRFTDDDEVSLKRRPPFSSMKIPCTHFCYRLCRPQGQSAVGRVEKSNDLLGIGTRDLPACSIVPQSTTLPRAP